MVAENVEQSNAHDSRFRIGDHGVIQYAFQFCVPAGVHWQCRVRVDLGLPIMEGILPSLPNIPIFLRQAEGIFADWCQAKQIGIIILRFIENALVEMWFPQETCNPLARTVVIIVHREYAVISLFQLLGSCPGEPMWHRGSVSIKARLEKRREKINAYAGGHEKLRRWRGRAR